MGLIGSTTEQPREPSERVDRHLIEALVDALGEVRVDVAEQVHRAAAGHLDLARIDVKARRSVCGVTRAMAGVCRITAMISSTVGGSAGYSCPLLRGARPA